MDAVEFLKEKNRMTKPDSNMECTIGCINCPLSYKNNGSNVWCAYLLKENPEKAVSIVEKWSAEHPKETRQSKFLKMFPNAELDDNGTISICPLFIEPNMECRLCSKTSCDKCRKKYWLAEVE